MIQEKAPFPVYQASGSSSASSSLDRTSRKHKFACCCAAKPATEPGRGYSPNTHGSSTPNSLTAAMICRDIAACGQIIKGFQLFREGYALILAVSFPVFYRIGRKWVKA